MTAKRGKARKLNEVIFDVEGAASLLGVSNLNPYAEGWVETIKSECLEHFFIFGKNRFEYLVKEYVKYYEEFIGLNSKSGLFWPIKGSCLFVHF